MGKIAFVFPGQGAQYPGMGKELAQSIPAAAEVFRRADALRPGTSVQCFGASEAELAETKNTQPCIFTVGLAAAAAVRAAGIAPDMIAGFSLGEVTAAACAGMLSEDDAFRLVCRRGELMQAAAEQFDSGMAAVLRLDAGTIERLCADFEHVYPVNYNCPGQITVSGLTSELRAFCEAVKAAGGRAVPLKVRGGFHSPFMAEAAAAFGEAAKALTFLQPHTKLYSNYTGLPYRGDYADQLTKQICNPVRWETIIRGMIEEGADTFIELGPGSTLCALISKTDASVRTFHVDDSESLAHTIREALPC